MIAPKRVRRWALTIPLLALPAASPAARLDAELTGVGNDHGMVRGAVCTPGTLTTKHCPFSGAASARSGSVAATVDDIPPGQHAVQAYHDEDGNGRLRRGLIDILAEAIGFSRGPRVTLRVPSFEGIAIVVAESATATRLQHVGP